MQLKKQTLALRIMMKHEVTVQPLDINTLDCAVCTHQFAQTVVVMVNLHGSLHSSLIDLEPVAICFIGKEEDVFLKNRGGC